MVEIYGNKIWNNATSNDEKTILNVEKDTLQSVLAVLESAALNYCYYIQNNICSIAVNSSDIPKLTIIPEMQHINKSSPRKNSTPQNIIGNTNYRDIREKAYQKLNTDLALKVAEILTDSHIPFSGRIYNKNTTLTVNDNDKEKLDEIIQAVQNQRNLFRKDTENVNKIYSEINNNGFTDEQKSALIPAINLCYLKGENLSDILIYDIHEISDYSVEQLKKFSETFVDSYQNLSEYEFIFGGQEVRNLKEQIEKEILFERVTRLRGYDNEQKDAIKQLINNGVSETILGILDYNFSSDDLLKISDILKSDNVLENLYKHISDVKNIDINTLHNHFRLNTYMPDTAEIFWFMYDTETADIFEVPNKGKIVTIDIEPNRGLWNRLAEHSLLLNENSEQRILFETDGKDWNKIIIPDVFGNKTNNIDVSEILTSEELSVMQEISDKVLSGFYSQLEFEQPLSEPDVTFAPSGQKSEIPIAESDMSIKISKSEFIDFATDDKPTAEREKLCKRIENISKDFEECKKIPLGSDGLPVFELKIGNTTYTDRKEAAKALEYACNRAIAQRVDRAETIGSIYGFPFALTYEEIGKPANAVILGAESYNISLNSMGHYSLNKLEKAIFSIENQLKLHQEQLNKLDIDMTSAKEILDKPFEFEEELSEKETRLFDLTKELRVEQAKAAKQETKKERTHYFGKDKILGFFRKNSQKQNEVPEKSKNEVSI